VKCQKVKFHFLYQGPSDERIKNNLEHYRQELRKSQSTGKRGDTGFIDDDEYYKNMKDANVGSETEAQQQRSNLQDYEKLCRGEVRTQVSFYFVVEY